MSFAGLVQSGSYEAEYFYRYGEAPPPREWPGVSLAQMTERLHRGTISQDEYEEYCREWEATHPYHNPPYHTPPYTPTRQHVRHSWPAYALVERLAYIAGQRPLTPAETLRGRRIIAVAVASGVW